MLINLSVLYPENLKTKHVLVLFSLQDGVHFQEMFKKSLVSYMKSSPFDADFSFEYLDLDKYSSDAYLKGLVNHLNNKYRNNRPDAVVIFFRLAMDFVEKYGPEMNLSGPFIFCTSSPPEKSYKNVLTIVEEPDFKGTAETAIKLIPGVKYIAVSAGTTIIESSYLENMEREFANFGGGISFIWLTNETKDELIERVSGLPPHSIILATSFTRDSRGDTFNPFDILVQINKYSSAPMFTASDSTLGSGTVGGLMISYDQLGRMVGTACAGLMEGHAINSIRIPDEKKYSIIFDWRELKKWGIPEYKLPSGSRVVFREYSFWEKYFLEAAAMALLIILETALIMVLLINMNRRRKAEAARRESDENFRELFEYMSSGVAIYEALDNGNDFIIRDINPAAEKIEKKTRKSVVGKKLSEAFPGAKDFGIFPVFRRVWLSGQPEFYPEAYYKDESGIKSWRENWVFKLPGGNIIALYNDISQRKHDNEALRESEMRFRRIIEESFEGICIADEKGIVIAWNKSLEKMTRMKAHDSIGRPVWDMIFKRIIPEEKISEKYETIKTSINKYLGEGASEWTEKKHLVEISPPGKKRIFIELRLFSIQTDKGYLLVSILQDITKKKISEEKIKNTLREKEALLRELYHRTKNNMQVICSLLDLQSNYLNDASVKKIFREMENRIHSMALVHQKLYQSNNLSSISLREYVLDLTGLLGMSYKSPGCHVVINTRIEDLSIGIDTAIPFGLILNELVSNAYFHAFSGCPEGVIDISIVKTPDGEILLSVKDNGIGAPSGFDFRAGSKMGLRTVFSLAEYQLHGSVKFSNEPGVNCMVQFREIEFSPRV